MEISLKKNFIPRVIKRICIFFDATRDSILDDVVYFDGEKDGVPVEVATWFITLHIQKMYFHM